MFDKIRLTFKTTAIYSIGNIATKLVGIILLPLYTAHITVADYGLLGILEISISILTQVLMFGQHQAYVRFFCRGDKNPTQKDILYTLLIFLLFVGLVLNIFGNLWADKLAHLFDKPEEFKLYIHISLLIIAVRLINKLVLSSFRAKENASLYVVSNVTKLVVTLCLNIYFVAFLKIGIKGILYSYVIGEIIMSLLIFPKLITDHKFFFSFSSLIKAIKFGSPLIFVALGGMFLSMGDRYILKFLGNYEEVGLYNLGYKIANILSIFLIQSFQLGIQPIAYKMFKQKGDKRFYSKMLTYSMFVLTWAGLGLAIIGKELIKTLALNSDYWIAYTIVPYIIFGLLFSGARAVVNIGLYITHKTSSIAINTICAAVLNILLNFLLIPKFHMLGAAYATIISFIVLYFLSYRAAQKQYKIPYENKKLMLLIILWIVLISISSLTNSFTICIRILIKILIFVSFPFILYLFNFFEPVEIRRILGSLRKWKNLKPLTHRKKE